MPRTTTSIIRDGISTRSPATPRSDANARRRRRSEHQECEGNKETVGITTEEIMREPAFLRGVADLRSGRSPRFDTETEGGWLYEWGRQFAVVAPRNMQIVLPKKRKLNPRALELLRRTLGGNGGLIR